MKYGESAFDIAYLLLALVCGCIVLRRATSGTHRRMGAAILTLGIGDAFHLVPRVIRYFSAADLTAALGLGKLVTSLTMTAFYVMLFFLVCRAADNRRLTVAVWLLAALRAALCLFPQNGWLDGSGDLTWAIARNAPFCALGAIVAVQWYRHRGDKPRYRRIWLYITLSFLFYIPVAVGAGLLPALGMLMLPKTVCYVLIVLAFRFSVEDDRRA